MTTRRRWLIASVIVVGAAFGFLAWYDPDRPFHEMVERMREAGEPLTYDEIAPAPLEPEENGAADLLAALAWLDENVPKDEDWTLPASWTPEQVMRWRDGATSEDRQLAARFAQRSQPALALLWRAIEKPAIDLPLGPRDHLGFPRNDALVTLDRARNALTATAFGGATEKERVEAVAAIAALGARHRVDTGGDWAAGRVAADGASREIRCLLREGLQDAAAARRRLDPLLQVDWLGGLQSTFRAARIHAVSWYRSILDGTTPRPETPSLFRRTIGRLAKGKAVRLSSGDVRGEDVALYCEALRCAEFASMSSYPEAVPAISACFGDSAGADTFRRSLDHAATGMAMQRLARVALALVEHRAARGSYPTSLTEIASLFPGGVPLDPFTDAPFEYEQAVECVRLASRGCLATEFPAPDNDRRSDCLLWELPR